MFRILLIPGTILGKLPGTGTLPGNPAVVSDYRKKKTIRYDTIVEFNVALLDSTMLVTMGGVSVV